MDTKAKVARAIKIGEVIQQRRCAGFSSGQLRQAMRALSEVKYSGECTLEQSQKIEEINLFILTQLDIRGDTFVWSREQ